MVSLEEFKKQLSERNKPLSREELKVVNKTSEAINGRIKLVKRNVDRWKTILSYGFIIIVICISILTYLAYTGNLEIMRVVLPNIPECPECPQQVACPDIPSCPSCNVTVVCPPMPNNIYLNCSG